jgi:hypothetical protein
MMESWKARANASTGTAVPVVRVTLSSVSVRVIGSR